MASRRLLLIDAAGLFLVALFGTWIVFCGVVTGQSPWPMLLTLSVCAGAFVAGWWVSERVGEFMIPGAVVTVAIVTLGISRGSRWALQAGFLGYGNANAAFFVQAAFATLMIAAAIRSSRDSLLISLAAAFLAAVTIRIRSLAGLLTSLLLIPGAIVVFTQRAKRIVTGVALVVVAFAVVVSFPLAREFHRVPYSFPVRVAAEAVGYGRAALWGDAYPIIRRHPLVGVGPGGFRITSRTAREHAPLRWAHNEYLQQAAETGLVGVGLLLIVLGWTFLRLMLASTLRSTLGVLALATFLVHATVDYLFHFPALVATVAALAGSTLGSASKTRRV